MIIIYFIFNTLYSLSPHSHVPSINNKMLLLSLKKIQEESFKKFKSVHIDSKGCAFLVTIRPSYYQKEFLRRIDITKQETLKKHHPQPLKRVKYGQAGGFSRAIHYKTVDKKKIVRMEPNDSEFAFTSSARVSNARLYSSQPQQEQQLIIQKYHKRLSSKRFSLDLYNKYPSFESTIFSHFQFLVEIFENKPTWSFWKNLSPDSQIDILVLYSLTLLMSDQYSEAKRIASLLQLTPYSANYQVTLEYIIAGNINSLCDQFEDFYPFNFADLSATFKLRYISACQYKSVVPLTCTKGDYNYLKEFQEGDLRQYLEKKSTTLNETSYMNYVNFVEQLLKDRILQCDARMPNVLITTQNGTITQFVATDIHMMFTEVDEDDLKGNLNYLEDLFMYHYNISNLDQFVNAVTKHPQLAPIWNQIVELHPHFNLLTQNKITTFTPVIYQIATGFLAQTYSEGKLHLAQKLRGIRFNADSHSILMDTLMLPFLYQAKLSDSNLDFSFIKDLIKTHQYIQQHACKRLPIYSFCLLSIPIHAIAIYDHNQSPIQANQFKSQVVETFRNIELIVQNKTLNKLCNGLQDIIDCVKIFKHQQKILKSA